MQTTQLTNQNNQKQLWQRDGHMQSKDWVPTDRNQWTQNQKQLTQPKLPEISLACPSRFSNYRTTICEENQWNKCRLSK